MLRHRSDWLSVMILATTLLSLWLGFTSKVAATSAFWIIGNSFLCFLCTLINHNQMHTDIWKQSYLNALTNCLLSITMATPVTGIVVPHVQNHHSHACGEEDWSGLYLAGNTKGIWRYLVYTLKTQLEIFRKRPRAIFQGLSQYRKVSFVLEVITGLSVFAFGISYAPGSYLLHCLLPAFLGLNGIVVYNLMLHDRCDPESKYDHSQNFDSKLENFILLNSGLHTAHHEKPKMHWSLLCEYHEKNLKQKVSRKFQHRSILSLIHLR